jgi:hypothetical protein
MDSHLERMLFVHTGGSPYYDWRAEEKQDSDSCNPRNEVESIDPTSLPSNGYNIYTSSLSNKHEFGRAFLVDSKHNQLVMNFTPINGEFKTDPRQKDLSYEELELACPGNDLKIVMGDANAKINKSPPDDWQIYVQDNPPTNLALSRWLRPRPNRSLHDWWKEVFAHHWCEGAEGWKYWFESHTRCRDIENQVMQSIHNTARTTTETLGSRKTEVWRRSNAISLQMVSKFRSALDVQTRSLNKFWYGTEEKIKKVTATTVVKRSG